MPVSHASRQPKNLGSKFSMWENKRFLLNSETQRVDATNASRRYSSQHPTFPSTLPQTHFSYLPPHVPHILAATVTLHLLRSLPLWQVRSHFVSSTCGPSHHPLCCYATALEIRQGSCDQSSADFAAFILKLVKMLP